MAIRLAGNAIAATGHSFGHLQIVNDATGQELEVQAGIPHFSYRNQQSHSQNTDYAPGSPNADNYHYGISGAIDLGDRDFQDVWNILLDVNQTFLRESPNFLYNFGQNSNAYAATLLWMIGIDISVYLADATPDSAADLGSSDYFPSSGNIILETGGDLLSPTVDFNLTLTDGADFLRTGDGNDTIIGGEGHDTIRGGNGNDIIVGDQGSDVLFGGEGHDLLDYSGNIDGADASGSSGVQATLFWNDVEDEIAMSVNDNWGSIDYVTGFEEVKLTNLDDTFALVGNPQDILSRDFPEVDAGDNAENGDTLDLSGVTGPAGLDVVLADDADQTLLLGDVGSTLEIFGTDFENVIGTSSNDVITGNQENNVLIGGDGADQLQGGAGDDTLIIDIDDTSVSGGDDFDTVFLTGTDNYNIDMSSMEVEAVIGGGGNDTITAEVVITLGSNTPSFGSDGHLILAGGQGDDRLVSTTDVVFGGGGFPSGPPPQRDHVPVLFGGEGADTFVINAGGILVLNANITEANVSNFLLADLGYNFDLTRFNTVIINPDAGDKIVLDYGTEEFLLDVGMFGDPQSNFGYDSFINPFFDGTGTPFFSYVYGGSTNTLGGNGSLQIFGNLGSLDGIPDPEFDDFDGNVAPFGWYMAGGTVSGTQIQTTGGMFDVTLGTEDDDIFDGTNGSDWFVGSGGSDTYNGSGGNFQSLAANATVSSTLVDVESDRVSYGGSTSAVNVDLASGVGTGGLADGDTYISIEDISGSAHADIITGNVDANTLFGAGGNDTLSGGANDDVLEGGVGNDHLIGGDGDDVLYGGDGDDTVGGGIGRDLLYGDAGADSYTGGNGSDTVSYVDATVGLTIDLENTANSTNIAEDDSYVSIEFLHASNFGDTVSGSSDNDKLYALDGDDSVLGLDGDDQIFGGDGEDTIYGGSGDDRILGGKQRDVLYGGDGHDEILGGSFGDTIEGGAGDDTVWGGAGNDLIDLGEGNNVFNDTFENGAFGGLDTVISGSGNDLFNGKSGDDDFASGGGDDTLFGAAGDDRLDAGDGADNLNGGAGDDTILGGAGDDVINGGAGADTFVFETNFGTDILLGFQRNFSGEVIDLTAVSEIVDFADLQANHLSQVGSDAVISDGLGNSLTLIGINETGLDADNFAFI
ncbi:MAG: hypothetical protein ABJ358_08260 [Rhizobiaceae bacterium]